MADPKLLPFPYPLLPLPDAGPPALPAAPPLRLRPEGGAFARFLVAEGVLSPHALIPALISRIDLYRNVCATLLSHGLVSEPNLTMARARYHEMPFIDPAAHPPDVRLIDRLGAPACLRDGLLPWRQFGGITLILTDRPEARLRQGEVMQALYGPVVFALTPRATLETAVQDLRVAPMRHAAETRSPEDESCRSLDPAPARYGLAIAAATLLGAALMVPGGALGLLTLLAVLAMLAGMGLKTATLLATLRSTPAPPRPPAIARLPVVSIMVALLHEADIAPRLVHRLGRIDYPRELLDILLVVEDGDTQTRDALTATVLPPWMRILTVPGGALRTKPRALNYALDFCRGSLIGVYDAEDAPDPAQIRAVVDRFHQRGPKVACLQGMLDFYNPRTNWLARCFTLEYAAWFRVILPGLDRLGLPVPLGGTTLFFRRAALEALGAWDAHNVTEDADLGIRLCRHGYRTEVIETVTREEANCHVVPWVRQRSRWIKGYMMTWRVHMRDPARLWRDLGPKGFAAFQILILGSLIHALLAPALLSFWLIAFGLPHPLSDVIPPAALVGLFGLFLLSEAVNLTLGLIALRRSGQRLHPAWLLTLHLYYPLASIASIKALAELVWRPHYWDKTRHGRHDEISEA